MQKDTLRRLMAPLTYLNRLLPKNPKRVVFYSNMGFRDNVKAVYDAFIRCPESKDYEIICALNDHALWESRPHPANVRFTDNKGGLLPFLTSRTFFYSFGKYPVKPSPGQMVVNVWHGSPLKKIGRYEKEEDQDFFTYVLAASDFFVPIMAKAFGCPKEKVAVCGHPRNDAMFTPGDPLGQLGIEKNFTKLILWLPTFRQSSFLGDQDTAAHGGTGLPVLESQEDLAVVNELLERENALLLAKIHPAQDLSLLDLRGASRIKILTNDDMQKAGCDLYALLGVSDGLITDYSSVYFDYLLLNRPIGFTVGDIEEYRKTRGFVVDDPYPLMPGPFIRTPEEFADFLRAFLSGEDNYRAERERVGKLVNRYPGGQDALRCLRIAGLIPDEERKDG